MFKNQIVFKYSRASFKCTRDRLDLSDSEYDNFLINGKIIHHLHLGNILRY